MMVLAIYLGGIAAMQIAAGLSHNPDRGALVVLSPMWPLLVAAVIAALPFFVASAFRAEKSA